MDGSNNEHESPPAAPLDEEVVPATQLSQSVRDDDDGGDRGAGAEPATPRRGLFSTPARQRGGGREEEDDDEEEVAETPHAASGRGVARQLAADPAAADGLAEEILSSVRKPRQQAGGAEYGEEEEDDPNDRMGGVGGGSVMSMLSGRRSRASRADDDDNDGGSDDGRNDNDDGDDPGVAADEPEEEDPDTLIRGTDVNVQSAAAAFRDFLRNFVSVEDSERRMAREEAGRRRTNKRRRRAAAGGGAGGGGGDADDDDDDDDGMGESRGGNSWDLPSEPENEEETSDDEKAPVYLRKLEQILLRGRSDAAADAMTSPAADAGTGRVGVASLDLDALHLNFHSPECQRLYGWLVDYPGEIVPLMDILLGRELEALRDRTRLRQEELLVEAEANGDEEAAEEATGILELLPDALPRVQVRPFHLRHLSHMRSLDPSSIDSLLSLRGMVVRTSPVIPDLKVAFFRCSICGRADQVTIDRGRIAEPVQCPMCHVRHGYELVHNRCYFSDKQMVRVQETPDEVPAGETPASIVVFAYDDLVDAVRPGDRVEVTGVFRAQARRVNPKVTKVKSVYKTYVDAIHFRKVVSHGVAERDAETARKEVADEGGGEKEDRPGKGLRGDEVTHGSRFPPARVAELEALSKQPDVYERLVKALAPSIWEMDDVKKGVLCMLFGGNSKKVKKGTAQRRKNREKVRREMVDGEEVMEEPDLEEEADDGNTKLNKRGDINILLVGDPGTSKSQLLGYVHKLSPRGVYTSGKGSSAVGLTASVVRDPETRELVMESGALVLSDLGICCIDEFVSVLQFSLLMSLCCSAFINYL